MSFANDEGRHIALHQALRLRRFKGAMEEGMMLLQGRWGERQRIIVTL
jgi:hypothetical protein